MNRKALGFLTLLAVAGLTLAGAEPQAVLQSLKGKVEVRAPGQKAWVAATEGQVLSLSATLSTGFDSSVVVVIDKTTIQVKPLTRLSIDKLSQDGSLVKTTTFLRVGSVSAAVKSAEGVKQDFKVQSPYSTASVRGTEFDYDGLSLKVKEGLVAFVMGRAKRDVQDLPSEAADDFTGAPDVEADDTNVVPVAAGKEVALLLDFQGDSSTRTGDDKGSLEQGSGLPKTSKPGTGPSTSGLGGVHVTIQFVN